LKYTTNYNLRKPERTDPVNINDFNINADILDQELTPAVDPAQVPESNGPGKISQWISWIINRIKAITGKANWYEKPDATLMDAADHIMAAAPHSGHVLTDDVTIEAAPNKLLKLNGDAKLPASVISGLAAVASSGSYSDLSNVPVNNRIVIGTAVPASPAVNDFWIDMN